MKKLILLMAVLLFLISCSASGAKKASYDTGDTAHDFSLPDQNGEMVTLSKMLAGKKGAVIAFYPKDDSKN